MKKTLLILVFAVIGMAHSAANADSTKVNKNVGVEQSTKKLLKKMDPSIKLGGYSMGKYSWNDRAGQCSY